MFTSCGNDSVSLDVSGAWWGMVAVVGGVSAAQPLDEGSDSESFSQRDTLMVPLSAV